MTHSLKISPPKAFRHNSLVNKIRHGSSSLLEILKAYFPQWLNLEILGNKDFDSRVGAVGRGAIRGRQMTMTGG